MKLFIANDEKGKLIRKAINISLVDIEKVYCTEETFLVNDNNEKITDINDIIEFIIKKYDLTLMEEVKSLIKSIKNFNYKILNPKDRLKICNECNFSTKTFLGLRCKICGCFLSAKARMENEECPLGKWRK